MHGDEYRAREEGLQPVLKVEDLRRRVGEPEARKGFDVTPEQRFAYPTGEVGEVAEEALGFSRNGAAGVGTMDAEGAAAREGLGVEIYAVAWSPPGCADLADVDLEGAFEKKAIRNEGREW